MRSRAASEQFKKLVGYIAHKKESCMPLKRACQLANDPDVEHFFSFEKEHVRNCKNCRLHIQATRLERGLVPL